MDVCILAYLAGAIDSDGCVSIKRSTYHQRIRRDAHNPVFSERIMLKQVTPDIPMLLKETFGGMCRFEEGGSKNSKPLYSYEAKDRLAANACQLMLPFLRVKRKQAELVLQLRESKRGKYKQESYWFFQDSPDWDRMELITPSEATRMLGYRNNRSVFQAIRKRSLIAMNAHNSGVETPRIPRLLVERILANGGPHATPIKLVLWQENLWQQIKELNKIGISGTEVYFRAIHRTLAE